MKEILEKKDQVIKILCSVSIQYKDFSYVFFLFFNILGNETESQNYIQYNFNIV